MNLWVPEAFDERIRKLGLGLELFDAARRTRIPSRIDVCLDGVPFAADPALQPRVRDSLERIPRHSSCLHALMDRPGLPNPLNVRLADPSRRYVPRRLSIPYATRPTVLSPWLYPGAAWDTTDAVTALRGRVLRASGGVVRWARIEARLEATEPGTGRLIGTAHGDDRGDYLLLIDNAAATTGDIVDPLPVEITVYGLPAAPTPSPTDLPSRDPLWDLPLEPVSDDEVTRGVKRPGAYVQLVRDTGAIPLGRTTSFKDLVH